VQQTCNTNSSVGRCRALFKPADVDGVRRDGVLRQVVLIGVGDDAGVARRLQWRSESTAHAADEPANTGGEVPAQLGEHYLS
jgi:hypothetical protein